MCRALAEGGRRCPGGHSTTRDAQNARQRLCRARKVLAAAQAAGDQAAIKDARERVADAEVAIAVARILAGADQPDVPNSAGLRAAERAAVSAYTGSGYAVINQYVKDGYQVPAYLADDRDYVRQMRATVSALKRAVNRSKLTAPTTATRAVWSATAEQVYGPVGSAVGRTLVEDRFTSTSLNPIPPRESGDVTIICRLAAGTRALDINASGVACNRDEAELLLGPHQRFRVLADELVNGRRVIHMESALPARGT